MLNAAGDLTAKINAIFTRPEVEPVDDPDASLYSGGFFSDNDKRKMEVIRSAEPEILKTLSIPFEDSRLHELLFRYRARNWPDTLDPAEQEVWLNYRQQRLGDNAPDSILNLSRFEAALAECRQQELSQEQAEVLSQLQQYADALRQQLSL
jgi:exodeoxyribonuclease-1